MVHGDSKKTLCVLVGYYIQKCEILVLECRKLLDTYSVQAIPSFIDINKQINIELVDKRTNASCTAIEHVYETYLHKHFCSWNDLASPLLPLTVIIDFISSFETMFPICALVLSTSCSSGIQRTTSRPNNKIY